MQINVDKIYQKFEDNPPTFMAAAGGLLLGVSKVIDSVAHYKGSAAYAKDVARRIKVSKL